MDNTTEKEYTNISKYSIFLTKEKHYLSVALLRNRNNGIFNNLYSSTMILKTSVITCSNQVLTCFNQVMNGVTVLPETYKCRLNYNFI